MPLAEPIAAAAAREAAGRAAAVLARDPRMRLVYLFGSATDPSRQTVRDVDVTILTEPRLDLDELLRLRADLLAAVGVNIDLVSLNDAAIVLAHEVADPGRCLLAVPPEAETDFVVRARARYLDWKPFRDEQWKRTGERLAEHRRDA